MAALLIILAALVLNGATTTTPPVREAAFANGDDQLQAVGLLTLGTKAHLVCHGDPYQCETLQQRFPNFASLETSFGRVVTIFRSTITPSKRRIASSAVVVAPRIVLTTRHSFAPEDVEFKIEKILYSAERYVGANELDLPDAIELRRIPPSKYLEELAQSFYGTLLENGGGYQWEANDFYFLRAPTELQATPVTPALHMPSQVACVHYPMAAERVFPAGTVLPPAYMLQNRKQISLGHVIYPNVSHPSLLFHNASTGTASSGGACVDLEDPSKLIGLHLGTYAGIPHNFMLSVQQIGFVHEFLRVVATEWPVDKAYQSYAQSVLPKMEETGDEL